MNLNAIGDYEFDSRQADAIARQLPPAKGAAGACDVEHDWRPRFGQFFQADLFLGEIEQAVVNETLVALGARERDLLALPQNLRRLAGAHDRRDTEFATHDCRVASAPAQIGDDAFGLFENRSPIGISHFGDENAAFFELAEIACAFDTACLRGGYRFSNAKARKQPLSFFLQSISGNRAGFFQGLHRLRSRLKDENLARVAIFRPFDIYGSLVMVLDRARPFCQAQNLGITEHK